MNNLEILNIRLDALKKYFKVTDDLEIILKPSIDGVNAGLKGMVSDNKVVIYSDDLDRALDTLTHEFIEHVMKPSTDAYFDVCNSHIQMLRSMFDSYQKFCDKVLYDSKELGIERLTIGFKNAMTEKEGNDSDNYQKV